MGMFDDVRLSPDVLKRVREAYEGDKEIRFDGWQSKSLSCSLGKVELAADHILDGTERRPHFSGDVRFYQATGNRKQGNWEWLEFVAEYADGKLVSVVHVPENRIEI